MNETKPIDTGILEVKPNEPAVSPSKFTVLNQIWDKIPKNIQDVLRRFYANKKIFWPIAILFGILFLIIILGLLFGSTAPAASPATKKTPIPFVEVTPEASPSGDILTVMGNQLKDLNNQINSLDLGQNKLKPPVINYKVDF